MCCMFQAQGSLTEQQRLHCSVRHRLIQRGRSTEMLGVRAVYRAKPIDGVSFFFSGARRRGRRVRVGNSYGLKYGRDFGSAFIIIRRRQTQQRALISTTLSYHSYLYLKPSHIKACCVFPLGAWKSCALSLARHDEHRRRGPILPAGRQCFDSWHFRCHLRPHEPKELRSSHSRCIPLRRRGGSSRVCGTVEPAASGRGCSTNPCTHAPIAAALGPRTQGRCGFAVAPPANFDASGLRAAHCWLAASYVPVLVALVACHKLRPVALLYAARSHRGGVLWAWRLSLRRAHGPDDRLGVCAAVGVPSLFCAHAWRRTTRHATTPP